jgi:uncharacterized membrane protein YtjA (UPF0391 family)
LNRHKVHGGTAIALCTGASLGGPGFSGDEPPLVFDFLSRGWIKKEVAMLGWAVVFLVVGLIAAVLGFSGIAGTAVNIAWILAVVGIVVAIVFFVLGRRPPLS